MVAASALLRKGEEVPDHKNRDSGRILET